MDEKKVTNEKPVKIPLPFRETLAALLATKSPEEKKVKKQVKKTETKGK